MSDEARIAVEQFMKDVIGRNPYETEFHQAVHEVAESVMPLVLENHRYRDEKILERMSEPDRRISFRVTWEDESGNVLVGQPWGRPREGGPAKDHAATPTPKRWPDCARPLIQPVR